MRWSILAIASVRMACCWAGGIVGFSVVPPLLTWRWGLPPSPRAIESRRSEREEGLTRWPRSGSSHSGKGGIIALSGLGVSRPQR